MAIHWTRFSRTAGWSLTLGLGALLQGCGGGGGGGGGGNFPTPSPSVSLTTSASAIAQGASATLTWNATNATACTASQGWSGSKATSGSESTGALNATTTFALECTGPGGGANQSVTVTVVPPATVTLNATPTTVTATGSSTLTWSSMNAQSCTASGGWTGARAASGSEDVGPLTASNTAFTLTCTGIGGTSAPQSVAVTTTPPPAGSVIVQGKIQFERILFDAVPDTGLNPAAPVASPARGVVVEAIASPGNSILATTTTNALGDYAMIIPENSNVFIRAKAQMVRSGSAPTWDFRVRNNTNSNALYALDGDVFNVATGATRDLTAGTGWGGMTYTGVRAAAPFAILDTVYQAKELIRSAASVDFPALNLFWSTDNRPAEPFCPRNGTIVTTLYTTGGNDACAVPQAVSEGIYVLGNFEGTGGGSDTDEFDQHVIAHEFGHYVEDKFSRSDSLGGQHGSSDKLDLRVAFGEGWGNAFAGMAVNDPVYRDSFGGMTQDFDIRIEEDDTNDGWFSESSVAEILWDVFDPANESGDTLALGFGPIFAAMTDGQRMTSALTSIFSFLDALRDQAPGESSAINQLRNSENISGTDEFGMNESNNGGDPNNLPVYRTIALNSGQQRVCVRGTNGTENKLGNNKFFRLDLGGNSLVTINAIAAADPGTPGSVAADDPDIYVHRQGLIVAAGTGTGASEMISQVALPASTYIIEVLDYDLASGTTPHCMTLSVSGG